MRIAIVHSYYSAAEPSGENVVVDAQAELLHRAGHRVELISQATDKVATTPLYPLRAAAVVASGHGPSPIRQLRRFRPDVVHVHNLFPNWGTAWMRRWHGPLVATLHNYRPVCAAATLFREGEFCAECVTKSSMRSLRYGCYRQSRLSTIPLSIATRRPAERTALMSEPARIIVLSERSMSLYRSFGIPAEKMALIPNFVDGSRFRVGKRGDAWVYLGRLTKEKGVRDLIDRWPSTERLDIYGSGPLLDELRAMASPNITVRGSIENRRVPEILADARGLIFPSLWPENSPIVYLESLAAGRPVVALSGNAVADDITQGGHGLVVSRFSDLPSALIRVKYRWEEFSQKSLQRYLNHFSPETWHDRTIQAYDDAIRVAS